MSLDNMKSLLQLFESAEKETTQLTEASHPKGFQSAGHFADKKYTDKGLPKPYPKLKDISTGKVRPHPADKLEEENDHLDPNLAKAYNMGYKAFHAYKNNPQAAQAAQDKIESEYPQYAKMWLQGYRDGENLPQSVEEGSDDNYHHDPETLAQGALDAAARYIQDELGIDSGDNAGMFFQGENLAMILDVLKQYAEDELQNQRNDDTENVDPSLEEGLTEDDMDCRVTWTEAGRKHTTGLLPKAHAADSAKKLKNKSGTSDVKVVSYRPAAEEQLDEYGDTKKGQRMLGKVHHRAADQVTSKRADKDSAFAGKAQKTQNRAWERMGEKEKHGDLEENFGGGMRDRSGSDDKSFDLAECKAFLKKRI